MQCWKINPLLHTNSRASVTSRRRSKLFHQIVAKSVQFMSANDAPERDPVKFLLEGQNTATGQLDWKVVFSGDTCLLVSRNSFGPPVIFENFMFFDVFRLTFPMLRDSCSANSMQLGSVRIFDDNGLNILDLEDDIRPSSDKFAIHPVHNLLSSADSKYLNFDKEDSGLTVHPSLLKNSQLSKAADVVEVNNLETILCTISDLEPGCRVSGIAWITSLKVAAASSDGSIFVLTPWEHSMTLQTLRSHPKLLSFRFSHYQRMFASGHSDGKVCMIKLDAKAPLCPL